MSIADCSSVFASTFDLIVYHLCTSAVLRVRIAAAPVI
jgi:hypothetical protein